MNSPKVSKATWAKRDCATRCDVEGCNRQWSSYCEGSHRCATHAVTTIRPIAERKGALR